MGSYPGVNIANKRSSFGQLTGLVVLELNISLCMYVLINNHSQTFLFLPTVVVSSLY